MAKAPVTAFEVFVRITFRGSKTAAQVREQRAEFLRVQDRQGTARTAQSRWDEAQHLKPRRQAGLLFRLAGAV